MPHATSCVDALYEGVDRVSEFIPELPRSEVALARLLLLVGGAVLRDLEERLKPHGMNDSDFRTLMMLFASEDGSATPSALCALAEQSATNMTRIANALVKRELITRAHAVEDRRQVVLRITPNGRRFVKKLLPPLLPPVVDAFSCFTANERKTLEALLKKLALHIEQKHMDERS
ncbi:MarR family transcriptional repressor of emrRAB [Luteibacter sp. Sphag1AF]|uniref:MarR family winged helix-turn-helix transcriptional regulator n=1 Tax=Luteibacter sp. Sphag1AF TaxID=2587031 RepID=UPI0016127AF9|nr:MarR family transcriptional regulator [Luteibacter sp. Sphag1AF]MBB3228398.1 MarR family transcriptional repressor of emrRAB [Luteibacter sp. Sphag1AF]